MTIAESQNFYELDTMKYNILRNEELLYWLNDMVAKGYHSFVDTENLQGLIDNIAYWYEIKYPEREMEFYEGIRHLNFNNIEVMSKMMNINQLLYRLPDTQLSLMECSYRSTGGCLNSIYNSNDEVIGYEQQLFMRIDKKVYEPSLLTALGEVPYFLLYANASDGQVVPDYNIKYYTYTNKITLDELLVLFKEKHDDELDYSKLEECVFDHNCDLELRRKILQLVALKLLYSRNTIPERGYARAKRFINEFNKKMDLNLSTAEIDDVISKDYSKTQKVLKRKK